MKNVLLILLAQYKLVLKILSRLLATVSDNYFLPKSDFMNLPRRKDSYLKRQYLLLWKVGDMVSKINANGGKQTAHGKNDTENKMDPDIELHTSK